MSYAQPRANYVAWGMDYANKLESKPWGFPGGSVVNNPAASVGEKREAVLIPGLERSPGVGNGNPRQYSCLENAMGRGAWQTTVQVVTKSQTRLSD